LAGALWKKYGIVIVILIVDVVVGLFVERLQRSVDARGGGDRKPVLRCCCVAIPGVFHVCRLLMLIGLGRYSSGYSLVARWLLTTGIIVLVTSIFQTVEK
jgi:hypothetical protein